MKFSLKPKNILKVLAAISVPFVFAYHGNNLQAQTNSKTDTLVTKSVTVPINDLLQSDDVSDADKAYLYKHFVEGTSTDQFHPYDATLLAPEDGLDSLVAGDEFTIIYTNVARTEEESFKIKDILGKNPRKYNLLVDMAEDVVFDSLVGIDLCGDFSSGFEVTKYDSLPEFMYTFSIPVFTRPDKNKWDTPISEFDLRYFSDYLINKGHTENAIPGFLNMDVDFYSESKNIEKITYDVIKKEKKYNTYTWGEISDRMTEDFEFDRIRNMVEHIQEYGEPDDRVPCPYGKTKSEPEPEAKKERKIVKKKFTIGPQGFYGETGWGAGAEMTLPIGNWFELVGGFTYGSSEVEKGLVVKPNYFAPVVQGPIISTYDQHIDMSAKSNMNLHLGANVYPMAWSLGFGPELHAGPVGNAGPYAIKQTDKEVATGEVLAKDFDTGDFGDYEGDSEWNVTRVGANVTWTFDNGIRASGKVLKGLQGDNDGMYYGVSATFPLNYSKND